MTEFKTSEAISILEKDNKFEFKSDSMSSGTPLHPVIMTCENGTLFFRCENNDIQSCFNINRVWRVISRKFDIEDAFPCAKKVIVRRIRL